MTGNYLTPHLLVPIDSSAPEKVGGTQYNGTISKTISSLYNFDVPSSYSGKTCSLIFTFPTQSQLETSSFTTSGSGSVDFASLSGPAKESSSYSNAPSVKSELGSKTLTPGNSYTIATGACEAGKTVSYELSATGSYELEYFQDYNPCPIGLFIVQN